MNLDLTSWSIQSKNGMKTNRFKSVTGGDARTLFRFVWRSQFRGIKERFTNLANLAISVITL